MVSHGSVFNKNNQDCFLKSSRFELYLFHSRVLIRRGKLWTTKGNTFWVEEINRCVCVKSCRPIYIIAYNIGHLYSDSIAYSLWPSSSLSLSISPVFTTQLSFFNSQDNVFQQISGTRFLTF